MPVNIDSLKELQGLIKGMDIDDNGTINYTGIFILVLLFLRIRCCLPRQINISQIREIIYGFQSIRFGQ
jgi:hypothetical protein